MKTILNKSLSEREFMVQSPCPPPVRRREELLLDESIITPASKGDCMRLKLTCAGQFQGENFQANLRLAAWVKEIAARQKVTPSQIALAWLLAHGDDIVPIPGTKRQRRLEENAVAIEIKLDAEDLQSLDEAIPRGAATGQRYPDMSTVNR